MSEPFVIGEATLALLTNLSGLGIVIICAVLLIAVIGLATWTAKELDKITIKHK